MLRTAKLGGQRPQHGWSVLLRGSRGFCRFTYMVLPSIQKVGEEWVLLAGGASAVIFLAPTAGKIDGQTLRMILTRKEERKKLMAG